MAGKRRARRDPAAKLSLQDLERAWSERGPASLDTLRRLDPGAYLRVIAAAVAEDD